MHIKRIFAVFLISVIPLSLFGQEVATGFKVDTSPAGAEVDLIGTLIVAGLTPVNFTQGLEGQYRVMIRKYGYETYKSSVFLQADRPTSLTVKLHPKTRFKAAVRSAIIPGWGQFYTEQKTKGGVFLLLATGSAAYFIDRESNFNRKRDRYDGLQSQYDNATLYSQKVLLRASLASAKEDAYDAENERRIAIGAAIAVWSLNFLDILFTFPEEKGSMVVNSISLKPGFENDGAMIVITHRF